MQNRKTKESIEQQEPKSACEVLQEMLESSFKYSDSWDADRVIAANTINTNNLLRAKLACDLDMVGSPSSVGRNRFFTTRENYTDRLEEAQKKQEKSWVPRFRNKSSE